MPVFDPNSNPPYPIFPGSTSVGLRNVGSYQVSGQPFITGSVLAVGEEKCIHFPFVAKSLTLIASGTNASIRMHFNSTSSAGNVIGGNHYISLDSTEDSVTFDTKCTAVWISTPDAPLPAPGADAGFQLFASLTNIPVSRMYSLTGSGLTD